MKNNQLGFLTATGLLSTILTLIIVIGFAFASGGTIFSPGALNAQTGTPLGGERANNARAGAPLGGVSSHADIAGKCSLCHTPFWSNSSMADRCVVCHTDVAAQLTTQTPLHGTLKTNYPTLICRDCHPDHRGPISLTTDLSNLGFSHNSFGFLLNTHQVKLNGSPFGCADCHGTNYATYNQASCITCHETVDTSFSKSHRADFGADCLACHDGADTYGKNFNHGKVAFQLSGKHADVACNQCHINNKSSADLKATPQDCVSCHSTKDVHWGRLGTDCGSCHTPANWGSASFNHNIAAFKLTGQHIIVECTNCHINHILQGTPIACSSCHNVDDVHIGRLGTACDSCHTTNGWTPATFDHNLSAFKLTGIHAVTACANCHINHVLQGTPTDCQSCHAGQDKHNGQFGAECNSCHSTSAWLPARFDHSRFGFTLAGAHVNLTCGQCHSSGGYLGLSTACAACHAEPPNHFGSDCSQCHNTSNWNASFNHPGSCDGNCANHRNATCVDCHPSGYSSYTCLKCHNSNNPRD